MTRTRNAASHEPDRWPVVDVRWTTTAAAAAPASIVLISFLDTAGPAPLRVWMHTTTAAAAVVPNVCIWKLR